MFTSLQSFVEIQLHFPSYSQIFCAQKNRQTQRLQT